MVTAKRRKDYQPPHFLISHIHLDFVLDPQQTRVTNTMQVKRVSESTSIELDGVGLTLLSVKVDNEVVENFTMIHLFRFQ